MVIMRCAGGMGDAALPRLWRRIEDAHYSYLETDDSPQKLQQKKKLEDYIMEYLARAPHECKFRLSETSKVFHRTVNELAEFNAYRAGAGWAAVARYAANLLTQPWRKEYRVIRLYSGFYKHEVEANLVGAEILLSALGYVPSGAGRLSLQQPVCPDTAAAVSRDALVAHAECQIMAQMWEEMVSSGSAVTWSDIYRARTTPPNTHANTHAHGSEIYSNVPVNNSCGRYVPHYIDEAPLEEPIHPSYPQYIPQYMYPPEVPHCSNMPVMTQYVPYYYPVQTPYMIPTPVYPSIKQANTVPVNGYPVPYRYPTVPTAQLIELDTTYENDVKKRENSRRNSTSKSGFSDVTLPSLPRSDTQPVLSKAREDGMGTYESWDYVFRNLSSKDQHQDKDRYSPSLDRDSKTLDRIEKAHKRYQPTTLDLEDGLQALSLDHRVEELKKDLKKAKKRIQVDEKRTKRQIEPVPNPKADALITPKVAPDKVKLLTKKDIKDRKEVIKQQNSVNSVNGSTAEVKKVRKPAKLVAVEVEKPKPRPVENGTHNATHSSRSSFASSQPYDLKAQLVVSLDETDSRKPNGERPASRNERPASRNERPASRNERPASRNERPASRNERPTSRNERPTSRNSDRDRQSKWECTTCTYINKNTTSVCEMCGKSKKGPEIEPLTSGGRECPACTLVNRRDARVCDACGTSLEHCPTYI